MEKEAILKRLEEVGLDAEKALAITKGLRETFDNIVGINEEMVDWGLQAEVVEDYLKKTVDGVRKLGQEIEQES